MYVFFDLTIDRRWLGAITPNCPNQSGLRHIIIFPDIFCGENIIKSNFPK